MKDFESFDKIKEFVLQWKKQSDKIIDNTNPLDICDFDERNTYNQELGINICLDTILNRIDKIENELPISY